MFFFLLNYIMIGNNMKKLMKNINNVCSPAYFYLMLSLVALIVSLYDNMNNFNSNNMYCVGNYKCHVPSTITVFVLNILYIAFWTFALNCLCRSGYTNIAWFLVLIPFILFFVIIGYVMISQGATLV